MIPEKLKVNNKFCLPHKIKSFKTIKNENSLNINQENISYDSPVKKFIKPENRHAFTQIKVQKLQFQSPLGVKNLNSIEVNSHLQNKVKCQSSYYKGFKKHENSIISQAGNLKKNISSCNFSNMYTCPQINECMTSKRSLLDQNKQKRFNEKLNQYDRLLKKLQHHSSIISQLKKLTGQKQQRKFKENIQSKENNNSDLLSSADKIQRQRYQNKPTYYIAQSYSQRPKFIKRSTIQEPSQEIYCDLRLFRSVSMSNNNLNYNNISLLQSTKKYERLSINSFFIGKKLGQGAFGKVNLVKHKKTNAILCLKVIQKQKIRKSNLINQLALEIKIHKDIQHQNIVSFYGIFDDASNIYLILQYLQGSTLFSQLKKSKKLQQNNVKQKIFQITQGLLYLHAKNIVHRDIKPENIMITNQMCKICDFGWATYCDQRRKTTCGTLDYSAPQIVNGCQYDLSVDMWCLGVLTYELLYGKPPFYHQSRKRTIQKISQLQSQNSKIQFAEQVNVSSTAKDFILKLLKPQGSLRMTIEEAISHEFLAKIIQV